MAKKPANTKPGGLKQALLLLTIPAGLSLLMFGVILLPRWLSNPEYDYLYYSCESFCSGDFYVDSDGRLEFRERYSSYLSSLGESDENEITKERLEEAKTTTKFYVHDVSENESEEIKYNQARRISLDDSKESPDGYEFKRGGFDGYLFFFGSSSYGDYFLAKDGANEKQNIKSRGYGDARFLGWIDDARE